MIENFSIEEVEKDVKVYFESLSEFEKQIQFDDLDYQNTYGDKFEENEFLCLLYSKLKNHFGTPLIEEQLTYDEIEIEKYQGMTKSEYENMCFDCEWI